MTPITNAWKHVTAGKRGKTCKPLQEWEKKATQENKEQERPKLHNETNSNNKTEFCNLPVTFSGHQKYDKLPQDTQPRMQLPTEW